MSVRAWKMWSPGGKGDLYQSKKEDSEKTKTHLSASVSWRNIFNKRAAVQHFFGLIIQFNMSQILVALSVIKACKQVAIMKWRKTLQKRGFFSPVTLVLLQSMRQSCGLLVHEHSLPASAATCSCGHLLSSSTRVCCGVRECFGLCFPLGIDVPIENPMRHSQPLFGSMENI